MPGARRPSTECLSQGGDRFRYEPYQAKVIDDAFAPREEPEDPLPLSYYSASDTVPSQHQHLRCFGVDDTPHYLPKGEAPTDFPVVVGQLPSNKCLALNVLCWVSELTGVRIANAFFKGRNLVQVYVGSETDRQALFAWSHRMLYRDHLLFVATSASGVKQLHRILESPSAEPHSPKRFLIFDSPFPG